MRPLRSFLLLLIFLACFAGLHYLIPASPLFPSIYEFVPSELVIKLKSLTRKDDDVVKIPADTAITPMADTVRTIVSLPPVSEKPKDYPLKSFLDSIRYSRKQVRILYYGDSQIEGDRVSSYLRHSLRKSQGGTGKDIIIFHLKQEKSGIKILARSWQYAAICLRVKLPLNQ
jgi:hypothetical protein